MIKHTDLSGKKFNHLTLLRFDHKDKNGQYFYLCKCDCGQEKVMNSSQVKNGRAKTCGCIKERIDLVGKRFGRLVVERFDHSEKRRSYWVCRCDCGKEHIVRTTELRNGRIKSCGCYNRECRLKHDMTRTRLYKCWQGMKTRCYNQNQKDKYKNYGGRGVTVCDEWKDNFENFRDWALNNGYSDNLTLERIDVNGNYDPTNCKWATRKEQARNKRNTKMVEYNGEKISLSCLCENLGLNFCKESHKLDRGTSKFKKVYNL